MPPETHPLQRILGDKGYVGDTSRFITAPKHPVNFTLCDDLIRYGARVDFYRARGEHIMSDVQRLAALSTPFRGDVRLFAAIVDISIHMIALKQRVRHNTVGRRYDDCIGPWPHWDGAPVSNLPVFTLPPGHI